MNDTRKNLVAELTIIQNNFIFKDQDILTITGFMNEDQIKQHIIKCKNLVNNKRGL